MSEEYLRRYQETGEVGASTLGEVVPLGETLFPKKKEAERIPKAKRGPQARPGDPKPKARVVDMRKGAAQHNGGSPS